MLTKLDHIVLICPDINAGLSTYETLLGRAPDWTTRKDGIATALFTLENTAIELLAPDGNSLARNRILELLDSSEGKLTSLAFRTDDIAKAHHVLGRRGLSPADIAKSDNTDQLSGKTRRWQRFRCDDAACAGIKTFIIENEHSMPGSEVGDSSVSRLDHLVINTPGPERAIAHYGARLGLRFALDRTIKAFHTRFLFFRIGGLTLEIIHRTDQDHDPAAEDTLWGLTWMVKDLSAAHTRLSKAGLTISEIRKGRKPSTEVFTVKSGTLGIPTLFIAAS